MDEVVVEVGEGVGLGAETGESLFVDVGLERVYVGDEYIDSHVEFVAVQEERIFEVLLKDNRLVVVYIVQIFHKLYPSASRQSNRFHDPYILLLTITLLELFDKTICLPWQQISIRDNIECLLDLHS